jgi:hypothetical protein
MSFIWFIALFIDINELRSSHRQLQHTCNIFPALQRKSVAA